jgi:hypothetical protein
MALPACCTADVSCSGYAYPASSSPAEFIITRHHQSWSPLTPTLCCAVLAGYNITYTLTHLQDVNTY